MRTDEILIVAVGVMLIGSIYMGFTVQRSLYHTRKAFEALTKELVHVDLELTRLQNRLTALEHR